MWAILAAPWLARPSRRAATALSKCGPSALQHNPSARTSSGTIRWIWIALVEHTAAYRVAAPTVNSIQHSCDLASDSPLALHQRFPPLSPPAPGSCLGLRATAALCTAITPGLEAPTQHPPTQTNPTPPLPPTPPTSGHIPSAFVSTGITPITNPVAERDALPAPAPAEASPDASAVEAAAANAPGPSLGPSSELLQLMGQIRRSRSAVDLRLLLTRQAAVVDHLALVAAMTRLTQLSATSRRAVDRTAQRALVSELAEALAFSKHLSRCGARQLGTCLHSLAELGVAPSDKLWEALLDALCTDRSALLQAGNAVDVSVIALALARLNCTSRRAWRAVARGVEAHVASMSPQHVANTLSALARADAHEHRTAFANLLSRAVADIDALSGRNLANALWASVRHLGALGALGEKSEINLNFDKVIHSPENGVKIGQECNLFGPGPGSNPVNDSAAQIAAFAAALARRLPERLRQCPPTELAGVAWSLDRLGWREWPAWSSLGTQLRLSAGAMKPVELCTTAEALQAASGRAAAVPEDAFSIGRSQPPAAEAAITARPPSHPTGGPPQLPAAAAATTPRSDDPGEALTALFTAAALRARELRPQHLARLLQVLRQRVSLVQRTTPLRTISPSPSPPPSPPSQQQQGQEGLAVRFTPLRASASTSASSELGSRTTADGLDERGVSQDAAIFEGFVREARAQVLRTNPSAFPDLAVVSSLVSSLSSFSSSEGPKVMTGNEHASAGPYSEASPNRPGAGPGAGAGIVSPSAEPTAAAVLDHLAAAAAPLAAVASAAELRSVMAAFAAAGHFHSVLCTAVAARIESLARQVDLKKMTTGLQRPREAAFQQRQRSRQQQQQDAASMAVVAEVADLLGSLHALARLGFHNEGALDATQPTVAAAVAALPPPALSAALAAYAASGAVPLALASSLATELLRHLRQEGSFPQHSSDLRRQHLQHQQQRPDVGCLTEPESPRSGVEGPGLASVLGEERSALLEACQQWRASLLYPAGLAGIASGRLSGRRDGADVATSFGGNVTGLRLAAYDRERSGGAAESPLGFDRCWELVLSLNSYR